MPSRHRILDTRKYLSLCPLRPFDKLPLDPALTLPDSLCAHEYLYLRFNGLVV